MIINKLNYTNIIKQAILFVVIFSTSTLSSLGQCPTGCSPNLAPNPGFELTTVECTDSSNTEMFSDYAQVQDWFGTACQTCSGNGSTPDYYNATCSGNAGTTTCDGSNGNLGVFTKVVIFGANTDAREYVQAQLTTPLVAGQEYCVSVQVKNGGSSYVPTDGFGIWFTDQMVDIDTQNGGNQFIGPGSMINATPQIENPSGNFIDACTYVTGTFCATGNEQWIVMGNFKNGANTQFNPACGTGFCSGYVMMDNLSVTPACTNTQLTVTDDTLSCSQSVDVELLNTPSGATIEWISPAGFTGFTSAGPHTDSPSVTTTYTAAVETTNGCGIVTSDTLSQTVVVDCGPQINLSLTEDTICVGDCSDLLANVSGGDAPYSVTWNNGLPSGMGPHNVCPSTTTTYIATVVDNNGDSSTDTIVLAVNPLPSVNAGADVTICSGSSHDLLATGAQSYVWDNGIGAGAGPHTVSPTTTTVYTVTGTDANGCVNTDDLTVTVDNTGPSVSVTTTDVSCFGATDGSASASVTGNSPFTYSWIPSGGNSATENNLGAGNYSVEVTDDNGCVTTESVTINEPTEISLTMSSTNTDCSIDNGIATVSASGGTGSYTYLWSPTGGTTSSISNLSAGTYIVTVEDQNGCQKTDTVEIETVNGPVITVDSIEQVSCQGDSDGSISITVTGGNPGYNYSWTPSGGSSAVANNLTAGQYQVTVTDNAGCSTTEDFTLNEPTPISLNEVVSNANCGQSNGSIQLNATGGTGQLTYDWSDGSLSGSDVNGLTSGTYSVEVTDENGCSIIESYIIELEGQIPLSIEPNPAVIEFGEEIQLESIVGGGSNETYIWTPSNGLSCDTCPDPIASPSSTTTYYLTVTSEDGCTGTDSVVVIVNLPCEGAFLPTMFSPNNDGTNDKLCILTNCAKTVNLEIFNRWGELVFHSTDLGDCWDGTYKSKAVNSGVFVYKLTVVLTNQEVVEETGTITVVR